MNTFINITFLFKNDMECLIIVVQKCVDLNKEFRSEFFRVFWNWNTVSEPRTAHILEWSCFQMRKI